MFHYSSYNLKSLSNLLFKFIDQSLYECYYDLIGTTKDILLQDVLIQSMITDNDITHDDVLSLYYCDLIPLVCVNYLNYLTYLTYSELPKCSQTPIKEETDSNINIDISNQYYKSPRDTWTSSSRVPDTQSEMPNTCDSTIIPSYHDIISSPHSTNSDISTVVSHNSTAITNESVSMRYVHDTDTALPSVSNDVNNKNNNSSETKAHETVVNLSNRQLSPHEICILERGMKFCPTPGEPDTSELHDDLDKLRLKRYLHFYKISPPDDLTNSLDITLLLTIRRW